jgi:hypothetical protein
MAIVLDRIFVFKINTTQFHQECCDPHTGFTGRFSDRGDATTFRDGD